MHTSSPSSFSTLLSELLEEQSVVILLLYGVLISLSLPINERGGHEDLRGLYRRSVIPYVHMRMEMYCSNMP
jgi:hypothetical protein